MLDRIFGKAGLFLGVVCAVVAPLAQAQPLPVARLTSVFPLGGQVGKTVEVAVAGAELDDPKELHFSHPGIVGAPKGDPSKFAVTVAPGVPPGVYEARFVGRFGVSNPRAFMVGNLPETNETGSNQSLETASPATVNSVVNGMANANAADYYKFKAAKGQRLFVESFAKSLDSRMDISTLILNSEGRELDRNRHEGVLDFTAPEEGEYILKVQDFLFKGGPEYFYRVSLASGPHLDFVFPPVGVAGTKGKFWLYGRNLPGSAVVKDVKASGKPLEKLEVQIDVPSAPEALQGLRTSALVRPAAAGLDGFEYRFTSPEGVSNPVFVGIATDPVVAESNDNNNPDSPQPVKLPVEFVGQFYPRGDQDWISFEAKKGEVYWVELTSARLGIPSDPFVLIQKFSKDAKGQVQASDVLEMFDTDANLGGVEWNTSSRDPVARFEVKEDGMYRAQIRDLFNHSENNPALTYRLSIRKETPDFRLLAMALTPPPVNKDTRDSAPWAPFLRKASALPVKVLVYRRDGFGGEIRLSVEGLPSNVECPEVVVPANATTAQLLIYAKENASGWVGPLKIVGKARIGAADVVREVRGGSVIWPVADYNTEPIQSRETRDFYAAVSEHELAPVSLLVGQGKEWETSVAGKLQIPIQITRRGEFAAPVKFKALVDPVKEWEVDGKATNATLDLDLTVTKIPVGSHSFRVEATTTGKYRRLPPEEIKSMEEANKAAAAAAEKELADTAAASKKTSDSLPGLGKAVSDAEAMAKQAAEKLKAATAAAGAASDKPELAAARVAAETQKKEAEAKLKAAAEAKALAEKTVADLAQKTKEAQAKKEAAAKKAADLTARIQPRDALVALYAMPFQVKVTPAPITLATTMLNAQLAPGGKLEIPVKLTRLYGFADAVDVNLVLPKEAKGLASAKLTIPKDQSQGNLVLTAAADSTLGDQKLVIQAALKLNNQEIKVDQALPVKIASLDTSKPKN